MKLKLNIVAVFYAEDSYIPRPWLNIQDKDDKLWDKIVSKLQSCKITINFSRFVLKCEDDEGNTLYLGYNWRNKEISIGSTIGFTNGEMNDSKKIVLKSPKKLYLIS